MGFWGLYGLRFRAWDFRVWAWVCYELCVHEVLLRVILQGIDALDLSRRSELQVRNALVGVDEGVLSA